MVFSRPTEFERSPGYPDGLKENEIKIFLSFRMDNIINKTDPKGHTEAITEIVQEGLPGVPGIRLQIKIIFITWTTIHIIYYLHQCSHKHLYKIKLSSLYDWTCWNEFDDLIGIWDVCSHMWYGQYHMAHIISLWCMFNVTFHLVWQLENWYYDELKFSYYWYSRISVS